MRQADSIQMELLAVVKALQLAPEGPLTVWSDCQHVVSLASQPLAGDGLQPPAPAHDLAVQLQQLLTERGATVRWHADADAHPQHLAAHKASYKAAVREGRAAAAALRATRRGLHAGDHHEAQYKAFYVEAVQLGRVVLAAGEALIDPVPFTRLLEAQPAAAARFRHQGARRRGATIFAGTPEAALAHGLSLGAGWDLEGVFTLPDGAPVDAAATETAATAPAHLTVEQALVFLAEQGFALDDLARQQADGQKLNALLGLPGWQRLETGEYELCLPAREGELRLPLQYLQAKGSLIPQAPVLRLEGTGYGLTADGLPLWSEAVLERVQADLAAVGLKSALHGRRTGGRGAGRLKVLGEKEWRARLQEQATAHWEGRLHQFRQALAAADGSRQVLQLRRQTGGWEYRWTLTELGEPWQPLPAPLVESVMALYREHVVSLLSRWEQEAAGSAGEPAEKARPRRRRSGKSRKLQLVAAE